MKKKSPARKGLTWFLRLIGLFLLYVIGAILHATATDYQPDNKITLTPTHHSPITTIGDSVLTFMTWNVGYGGLGAKSDFFYEDEGNLRSGQSNVRPDKATSDAYFTGIQEAIKAHSADFYLLQEVDVDSKRAHHRDQLEGVHEILPAYFSDFATNYDVKRVPLPVLEPWNVYGKVLGGLGRFPNTSLALPIAYNYPVIIAGQHVFFN